MNPRQARQVLACRPPNGADDGEAAMKEALAAAEGDPDLQAAFAAQRALDEAAASELADLSLSEEDEALVAEAAKTLAGAQGGGSNPVKNPASIAVALGVLLIIAVLVWNYLGRAGTFPEEAIKIAVDGAKFGPEKFDAVDEKADGLQDWFMLKGFDKFNVPPGLEKLDVVGVRIFKEDDEDIAQVLVPENHLYLYCFPGQPYGIDLKPEKAWRVTEAEHNAYAIWQDDGMCFLLAFRGTKKDMQAFLQKYGALK